MHERFGIRFKQRAGDDPADNDPMVTDGQFPGDFRVKVAQRPLQNRGAGFHLAKLQSFEGGGILRETTTEVSHQRFAAGRQLIQGESPRRTNPVRHITLPGHAHADQRRIEARLLHPAREHAGGTTCVGRR